MQGAPLHDCKRIALVTERGSGLILLLQEACHLLGRMGLHGEDGREVFQENKKLKNENRLERIKEEK